MNFFFEKYFQLQKNQENLHFWRKIFVLEENFRCLEENLHFWRKVSVFWRKISVFGEKCRVFEKMFFWKKIFRHAIVAGQNNFKKNVLRNCFWVEKLFFSVKNVPL